MERRFRLRRVVARLRSFWQEYSIFTIIIAFVTESRKGFAGKFIKRSQMAENGAFFRLWSNISPFDVMNLTRNSRKFPVSGNIRKEFTESGKRLGGRFPSPQAETDRESVNFARFFNVFHTHTPRNFRLQSRARYAMIRGRDTPI